jgi:hypothetical protein
MQLSVTRIAEALLDALTTLILILPPATLSSTITMLIKPDALRIPSRNGRANSCDALKAHALILKREDLTPISSSLLAQTRRSSSAAFAVSF